MQILDIIEKFGIPVAVTMAFGYYIWVQNKWIRGNLMEELDESHDRLEAILIKLIDASKQHSVELRGLKASYAALVNIIKSLMRRK